MGYSNFLSTNQGTELKKIINNIRDEHGQKFAFDLIKKNKKNQQKFYSDVSFFKKEIKLSDLEIQDLINKKLLKVLNKKEGRLTPTLKAILMVEYEIMEPSHSISEMLNDINKEFFDNIMKISEELVTAKEKAVVIGLLGLGAITDQYWLKLDEKNKEYFKNAVNHAAKFIKELGKEFDDGSLSTLWDTKAVGEGAVLGEMRRLNKIQPHTDGACVRTADGKLYLDILSENRLDEDKLTYLLKEKIFDKKSLSFEEKKKLIKTLDEIQNYTFKIFKTNPPFSMLKIMKEIKSIIESDI